MCRIFIWDYKISHNVNIYLKQVDIHEFYLDVEIIAWTLMRSYLIRINCSPGKTKWFILSHAQAYRLNKPFVANPAGNQLYLILPNLYILKNIIQMLKIKFGLLLDLRDNSIWQFWGRSFIVLTWLFLVLLYIRLVTFP